MDIRELESKASELEQRVNALSRAEQRKNNFYGDNKMENIEVRNNIAQKFLEVRADEGLKINSTGKDYYGSLVEKFRMDKPLTSKASFVRGAYTGFQIPLISARPAVLASATEGDTALSVDTQMAIGKKTITPQLFYSILGITYQTEKFSMVTDAEIEDAFNEAFGEAIEVALQGRNAGTIKGVLSTDASVCASGNAVTGDTTWADIYALADKAKGKSGKWSIVMPACEVSKLISASAKEYSFCKEELLRNGTIRGIEVVEVAGESAVTGEAIATLIDMNKNYKVCVAADDVVLRTVYDKNSLNKYLQGAMGMAGEVVLPNEVFQLVKGA